MENKGQFEKKIHYQAEFSTHSIYLDHKGFSVLLRDNDKWSEIVSGFHNHKGHKLNSNIEDSGLLGFQYIQYEFIGANMTQHSGTQSNAEYYNYFIGDDQSKWASNVKKHTKVRYTNIYPNIDLEFEAIDRRFKYNFILNPGSDIKDILVDIKGAEGIRITDDRVYVDTRFGEYSEVMPISYEVEGGVSTQIKMKYTKRGEYIGFETPFFKTKVRTVIDPEVIFATYSGSSVDNFGFTATFDEDGNLYSGGIVTSPYNEFPNGRFPTTPGAYDLTFNGGSWDIGISKYSEDGATAVYITYIGGSADDYPHSLIVDENNNLIVFGTSMSSDYPALNDSYDDSYNGGTDIVLTKLNSTGSALVGSTFIGGSADDGINRRDDDGIGRSPTKIRNTNYFYADDYRGEVNLDDLGNIYVATSSESNSFPISVDAAQAIYTGSQSGVVFSLDPGLRQLRWSTYYGGNGKDALYSIDLNSQNEVVIAGGTTSTNLAGVEDGYQSTNSGGIAEGFICKLDPTGKSILGATYFGTSSYDQILLAELDQEDRIYVAGHTEGNFGVKGNVYSNANGKQFVSRFSANLDSLELNAVYGSGRSLPDITINAFLVDECGKVYVSGWGTDSERAGQNLRNMPLSPNAFQSTTDGQDFHLIVFTENLAALDFATYYGGNRTGDHVDGGTSRFDKKGIVYQSVCSSCPNNYPSMTQISDFPTTAGAFSENNPSPRCSNVSFKLAMVNYNQKPEMEEVEFSTLIADTVTVAVFDSFEFNYKVRDPEMDSLYVTFNIPEDLKLDLSEYQSEYAAIGEIDAYFKMLFTCKNAGDTFKIGVHARDIGCPVFNEDTATITVIVSRPEKLPPPDVMCLYFSQNDDLKIEWISTPESYYFHRMLLYKVTPSGLVSVIDTIYTQDEGVYIDTDVINPRNQDYTYYIVVEDICGFLGDKSYLLSSTKESEIPIESTYLKTTTVLRDSIQVVFLKSDEPDFGFYEVYRSSRDNGTWAFVEAIYDINDTSYMDGSVDMNTTSYCYKLKVVDKCGHNSTYSNIGCSIVIRGVAQNKKGRTPRYYMDLYWDDYIDWQDGVSRYELLRSVDTGNLKPIVSLNSPSLAFTDGKLDYDWGGYWYSVLAYENNGEHNAVSRSNDIYLIQPPEVFVPNAVTHNNDGLNDSFGWADVFVKEFTMDLYNRWGEKVFSTTDKNDRWSSVYKEGDLKYSNVYMWIVSYYGWDGNRHYDSGTVTFIK
jgi:hypothetical protein